MLASFPLLMLVLDRWPIGRPRLEMRGVTGAAGRMVAIAAGPHDLGKLAVPSETLEKERAH